MVAILRRSDDRPASKRASRMIRRNRSMTILLSSTVALTALLPSGPGPSESTKRAVVATTTTMSQKAAPTPTTSSVPKASVPTTTAPARTTTIPIPLLAPHLITPTTQTTLPPTSTTIAPVQSHVKITSGPDPVDVCAVLFLWYGYNQTTNTWTGGNGTSHWNNAPVGIVKDTPAAGYYASINQIPTQLTQMASAGINCAEVDWLPPTPTPSLNTAINDATKVVFQDAQNIPGFKVSLMVDAYNTAPITAGVYNQIYQYVNTNFYAPYASEVLKFQGEPLLTFFNTPNSAIPASNPNLTLRVIGNNDNQISPGWWFWGAPSSFFSSYGGSVTSPCRSGYCNEPSISPDGFISITPRYDDQAMNVPGGRNGYMVADPNYSKNLYQYEWNYVINQQKTRPGSVKMVLIYSWNEYHEQSEIEPHTTASNSGVGQNYLLNITASNITNLERSN